MDKKWNNLNENLKKKMADYEEPSVPFSSTVCLKDFNSIYASV